MSAPPSTRTNMRLDGNKFQRCQSALSHYRKRPPAGGSKAQMDCEPFMPDALRDRQVRFELRNVVANYPFESSRGFPGSELNSGPGDHSRLSCSAGDTQLGAGFCRDLQQASARTLAIMRR